MVENRVSSKSLMKTGEIQYLSVEGTNCSKYFDLLLHCQQQPSSYPWHKTWVVNIGLVIMLLWICLIVLVGSFIKYFVFPITGYPITHGHCPQIQCNATWTLLRLLDRLVNMKKMAWVKSLVETIYMLTTSHIPAIGLRQVESWHLKNVICLLVIVMFKIQMLLWANLRRIMIMQKNNDTFPSFGC